MELEEALKELRSQRVTYASDHSSIYPGGSIVGPSGPIGLTGPAGLPGIPAYEYEMSVQPSMLLRRDLEAASLILSDHFLHKPILDLELTYGKDDATVNVICAYDSIKKTLLSINEPCPFFDIGMVESMIVRLRARVMCYGLGAAIRQAFNIEDQSI